MSDSKENGADTPQIISILKAEEKSLFWKKASQEITEHKYNKDNQDLFPAADTVKQYQLYRFDF